MESTVTEAMAPGYFGDRSSSDTVVRLRTSDGRDDWLYCHSHILIEKSKYFADRLSEKWPTCQILDSRNCVEVYCQESDFDSHVNVLRLFYVKENTRDDIWHGVRNALGILRVAVELECSQIVTACVNYLEAVPWEETEEEEILKAIPGMGSQVLPILSRLEPVNPLAVMRIFRAAIQLATSSPPQDMNDLKTSAQEQLEYMLTEDDDEPLLKADDEIRSEVMFFVQVRGCILLRSFTTTTYHQEATQSLFWKAMPQGEREAGAGRRGGKQWAEFSFFLCLNRRGLGQGKDNIGPGEWMAIEDAGPARDETPDFPGRRW